MSNNKPSNYKELYEKSRNKTNYKERIEAIEELSKSPCREAKDILYNLMRKDLVYEVQRRAFLKLQAMGEKVKLPRKKDGLLIKDINKKLYIICNDLEGKGIEFNIDIFKQVFQEKYPEAYDVYKAEKKANFEKWIVNVISCRPKKK